MRTRRARLAALLAAAALGLVGCGGEEPDTEGVEQELEEGAEDVQQEVEDAGDDGGDDG